MPGLYWHTIDVTLRAVLEETMTEPLFEPFRLVGGTALSLQLGHRKSVDIDLFTDHPYDSIDFDAIDTRLREMYVYVSNPTAGPIGFGRSYFIGENAQQAVKVDIYYTEPVIRDQPLAAGVRIASTVDIAAMKIEVIQRGGRKKDFWDIHELMNHYPISELIALHNERYPHDHNEKTIRYKFTDFTQADDDLDPICLQGKHWEIIKLELLQAAE
jgi:hypothetical protein